MLKLRIVPQPREGSCILGLVVTDPAVANDRFSIINDSYGIQMMVDSLGYLELITTSEMLQVVEPESSVVVQDIPVSVSSDVIVAQSPVYDEHLYLANDAIHNVSSVYKEALFYKYVPVQYLWESSFTSDNYETFLNVGNEIGEHLSFTDVVGNKIQLDFDLGLPGKYINGMLLPNHVYSFVLYFYQFPSDATLVSYRSYNMATGKSETIQQPLNLELIFDNSRLRDIKAFEQYGRREYDIPFNYLTGRFGTYASESGTPVTIEPRVH